MMNITPSIQGKSGAAPLESSSNKLNPAELGAFSGLLGEIELSGQTNANSMVGQVSKLDKETQEKLHQKSQDQDQSQERLDMVNQANQQMDQRIQGKLASHKMGEASFKDSMMQVQDKIQQKATKSAQTQATPQEAALEELAQSKPQTEAAKFDAELKEGMKEGKFNSEKTTENNSTKLQNSRTDLDTQAKAQAANIAKVMKPNGAMAKEMQAIQAQNMDGAKGLKSQAKPNMAKPMAEALLNSNSAEKAGQTSKTLEAKAVKGPDRFEEMKNAKDVSEKMKVMIKTGKNEMTVRMSPEHLGKMEIKLQKDGDMMTASMKVESLAAKELLDAQMPELLENLLNEGIEVERVEVYTDGDKSSFSMNEGKGENHQADKEGTNPALTTREGLEQVNDASNPQPAVDPDSLLNLYA